MGGCQSLRLLDCFHQSKHSYNNNNNDNRKHQYSCSSSSYWPCCLCCCCCRRCCRRPLSNRPSDGDDVDLREAFPTWRPDSPASFTSAPFAQVWFLRPPTVAVAAESPEVTDADQAELSPLLQSSNNRAASPCRPHSPLVRLIQVVQTANQTNDLDSDALVVPDVPDNFLKDADQLSFNQVEQSPGSPHPSSGHLTAALSDFWNELGHTLQCLSYSTPVVCQVSRQMNGIAPTRLSILPASLSTSSVPATSFPIPPALPPTPPSPPLPPSPSPSRDSLSRQPFAIRSRRKFIRVSSLREHSGKS